ncbi:hypothetical protein D3C75_960320 [compost metagenome]
MVPHSFRAALRDREGHARQHVLDRRAVLQRLGPGGVLQGVVEQRLGQRGATVARVDLDAEAREAGGQLGGDRGQLVLVLGDVLAVDHQDRLLVGERIGTEGIARLEAGRRGGQAALVGRDGAIGIGGLLGADDGQGGAQLGGLAGRNRRQSRSGSSQRKRSCQQSVREFHLIVLQLRA